MARNLEFAEKEIYHIFNRGADKCVIFHDKEDLSRFLESMSEFNNAEPIGSIYENRFNKNQLGHAVSKLVNFICYCLNPNHFHFVLEQVSEKGVERFMHKLMGYSKYFNHKYKRSGVLFQGPFKAVHVSSNEQLLHVSAYVNLNDKIHKLGHAVSKSSWNEYIDRSKNYFCAKDVILSQFKNSKEYQRFAKDSLEWIKENREAAKFLLELE